MANVVYRPEMNNPILTNGDMDYLGEVTPYDISHNAIQGILTGLSLLPFGGFGAASKANPFIQRVGSPPIVTPNPMKALPYFKRAENATTMLDRSLPAVRNVTAASARGKPVLTGASGVSFKTPLAGLGIGLTGATTALLRDDEPIPEANPYVSSEIIGQFTNNIIPDKVKDIYKKNNDIGNMLPVTPVDMPVVTPTNTSTNEGFTPTPRQAEPLYNANYSPDSSIAGYDNSTWTKSKSALNNPLNERTAKGGYKAYNTVEDGIRGNWGLLQRYQDQHGLNTMRDVLARWSGAKGKKLDSYVSSIANTMGIDANAKIDLHDPNVAARLITTMANRSGNKITEDQVLAAIGSNSRKQQAIIPSQQITDIQANPFVPKMNDIYNLMRNSTPNYLRGRG